MKDTDPIWYYVRVDIQLPEYEATNYIVCERTNIETGERQLVIIFFKHGDSFRLIGGRLYFYTKIGILFRKIKIKILSTYSLDDYNKSKIERENKFNQWNEIWEEINDEKKGEIVC